MCEWEAWIHRCRHVIYHQYSTCSNEDCKQPKDAGFTPVYAIRYKWKCKRCDPTDPHHLSDLNIMIVGRQVVGLGNELWNKLKVEDGRETWVRCWTREDHSGGAAGGLVGCMDAFWFLFCLTWGGDYTWIIESSLISCFDCALKSNTT
jgi:hypothetical protein